MKILVRTALLLSIAMVSSYGAGAQNKRGPATPECDREFRAGGTPDLLDPKFGNHSKGDSCKITSISKPGR